VSATTLIEAWDHLIAEAAEAELVVDTAAIIESGALGRAVNGGGLATTWEIVPVQGPVTS